MSFSELAWDRFREFQLEVWFPEEQISETEAEQGVDELKQEGFNICLLYTSPRPRDRGCSRMPSSA